MKKLTRIAVIFMVVASFFAFPTPVSAQDEDHYGEDWTISTDQSIYGVHFNINTFTINSAVTATVDATTGMVEIHAQTVNINGTLTATGQGNAADTGLGAGAAGSSKVGGNGGGYGGTGGIGNNNPNPGGSIYGSEPAPIDMGSGGGSGSASAGGSGGGAIIIHCIGTLTIGTSGVIEADGTTDELAGGNSAGGGGSGGSIYITANAISGTGFIHANGGAGGSAANAQGGGGAGGRIVIHLGSGAFEGNTSAAGGSATSPATAGDPGTDITGNVFWRTYKQGTTDDEDVFSDYSTEHIVYVKGTGFEAVNYTIVFWDALESKIQEDTGQTGPTITSQRTFSESPADPAGKWYASVYLDGLVPASHSTTTNLKADYAFKVEQGAIPEFPIVFAAIAVAGLCFGIYYWMRKKFKKQNEKFKIRAQRDLG